MRSIGIAVRVLLVIALFGLPAGVQAQGADDGLVAEWHFDEGSGGVLRDSSGNGNDGVIHGATWVEGKYEKAMRLVLSGMGIVSAASSDVNIPYDDSYEVALQAPNTEKVYLVVNAKIDWYRLAGAGSIMRIKVNGNTITGTQLINKGPTWTYADGRTFSYYVPSHNSWEIFYSPDFESNNVAQSGYRVIDGKAYTYKFNVTDIINKGQRNTIIVEHTGPEFISLHELTPQDIKDIKSAKVVVGYVNFEGEGKEYPTAAPTPLITPAPAIHTALSITKSQSLNSIRQFGETTITISIENSGTTDATDIEITDAIHPSFDLISGDFPNPKRYDLIRPGETRDLRYTLTAKESGTFALDPATATYADEDGNIQEAKSEPASIKVIPSTEGSASSVTSHNPSVSTASVQLHGEKTDVVLGEDILLKLSAVNLITKPTMHVQVIIIPPSGMSVTSSAFAKSGAGQYTTTYELEPGTGKDIEVAIRSNQLGDFTVNGRIIYYFGDDREAAEDHTLTLPIKVRAEPDADQTAGTSEGTSTPGFAAVVAIIGLLAVYLRRGRR